MATVSIVIKTSKDPNEFKKAGQNHKNLNRLINLLSGLNVGALQGSIDVHGDSSDPVAASGSVAITHANVTNGDTVTIGGVVITAATSGNGTSSWTIGANATADAVAMAACINANTTLSKYVSASASTGTVTITSLVKGGIGNLIVMSTSDATAFALTQLTGGTGGPASAAETIGK